MASKPDNDLGKLNSDVLSEFDIDVEPPRTIGRIVSAPVKGVANIIGKTASHAAAGVTNELKNRFPDTVGLAQDALGVVDDLKSLKEDVSSELKPAWNTMKGITLKMMPMTKGLMPKSWYTKLEQKIKESYEPEDERSEQQKLEEARTENINQQISAIFSTQMEMQKASMEQASAEKQADRLLERTHFKAYQTAFASIDSKLQAANNFLSGAFTAYMKKSLELKYRHLYIANDTFNVLRTLTKITEARLEEIKHNTGLPEYAKTTFKERLIGSMKEHAAKSLAEKASGFMGDLTKNIREDVLGKIQLVTKNIVPMLGSMAGMFSDPSMVGGPLKWSDIFGHGIGMITRILTGQKTAGALDNQSEHIRDLEKMMRSNRANTPYALQSLLDSLRMSDNPFFSWLANMTPDAMKTSTKIDTQSLLKDPNATVPFDVSTRAAIVEIIPAHLERIGDYVEGLSKYIAPDLKLDEKTFNYVTHRLSSVKKMEKDLYNAMYSEERRASNMEEMLSSTMGVAENSEELKTVAKSYGNEKLFTEKQFQELLKKFYSNLIANHRDFRIDDIVKFHDDKEKSEWFVLAFKGLDVYECDKVVNYFYTICYPNGKPNYMAINNITTESRNIIGDDVTIATLHQIANRVGSLRNLSTIDTTTGEIKADKAAAIFNITHADEDELKHRTESRSREYKDDLDRHKEREKYHATYDDEETAAARKKLYESGMLGYTGAEFMNSWMLKLGNDAYKNIVKPTAESAKRGYKAIKKRVDEFTGNSWMSAGYDFVVKHAKELLKDSTIEIDDMFMEDQTTLVMVYHTVSPQGSKGDTRYIRMPSSIGNFEAPSPEEAVSLWNKLTVEELHGKLTKADYAKARLKFQTEGNKKDVKKEKRWVRRGKSGYNYSDLLDSETYVRESGQKPSSAKVSTSNEYLDSMKTWREATVVDIPGKLQKIIDMMVDSDIFVRSEKHGSSEPAKKDSTVIRANEGEVVLTIEQQKKIMEAINATRDPDHQIQHQDELLRFLGMPIDDDFKPLFSKGGRVRRKNRKKQAKQRARAKAKDQEESTSESSATYDKVGNNVADFVDTVADKGSKAFGAVGSAFKDLGDTKIGQKIKSAYSGVMSWFDGLKNTIINKDAFLSKFPEKWRDTIGKSYDYVVNKSNSIHDYFTTVSKDLKLDKAADRLTKAVSDAAETIKDPTARRHFIVSATQQLVNIKDLVADPNKRENAIKNAKEELDKLADKLKDVKKDSKSWFKRKWTQTKLLWRKFKRSKFTKWISSFVDDETKAKLKDDFAKAKSSVKSGWDEVSKALHLDMFKDDKKGEKKETGTPKTESKEAPKAEAQASSSTTNQSSSTSKKTEESGEKKKEEPTTEKPKEETNTTVADKANEAKPTASSSPSEKEEETSMFSGEPESLFHKDFRTFANRVITVLRTTRGGGGSGVGGFLGGLARGVGRAVGGIGKGVGRLYAGALRGAGTAIGGLAKGAGTVISGIANSGLPGAIVRGAGALTGGLARGYGALLGGTFRGIGAGIGGIAKGIGGMFGHGSADTQQQGGTGTTSLKDKLFGVGSAIRQFVTNSKPKYVDIYWKDMVQADMILLSAKQQEAGVQFEDGTKVECSADITKPVFGKKPGSDELQCLITMDDIKHGLVDKDNKPITESKGEKSGSILDKMGLTGKLLKLGGKVLGGIGGLFSGLFGLGKKGLEFGAKGAKTILGRLFGIDGHDFSNYHKSVLERLDRIIVTLGGEPSKASEPKTEEAAKPEEQKPADESVANESGQKVAEGTTEATNQNKETSEKKRSFFGFFKKKDKSKKSDSNADLSSTTLVEDGEQDDSLKDILNESKKQSQKDLAEKTSKSWFARLKEFFVKEKKEEQQKAKPSMSDRLKEREEKLKKEAEEKKKRQAERDAVNDKAEKEGADRLNKLKSGYQTAKERLGVAGEKIQNVKNSIVDSIMGSPNQFGRRTGGFLRGSKAKLLTKLRAGGHKGLARFVAKPGVVTKGLLRAGLTKGAGLLGKGALAAGKGLVGLVTNPIGLAVLGAAAAGYSIYKGVKGASKKETKKNLGIKEGVQAQDRVASGLSQALTFGFGGKRAAKFTRKMLDYSPAMAVVKAFMGDKDAMSDKEISIFRAKCENKIKKGMKGYETILARFNKAVRNEDWPLARSISGNETSLFKTLASPVTNLVKDVGGLLFGSDDKPLSAQQIKAFQKKCQTRIQKGDKNAQKILDQFNEAVSEQNWKKARDISGKKSEGLLNRSYSNKALAFMGPAFWIIDAFKDPNNKPLTKSEIKETMEFLSKQAAYNPKAKPVLAKFQEAVENEDWKTARKLSGKKGKTFLGKMLSNAGKTLEILSGAWLFTTDQEKPLTEKEIQDFRNMMQFRIKKGDSMASRKLEAFDDAIAQQNWKKARTISKIKDEAGIVKVGKFLKKISWDWIVGNDEEPMKEAEIEKFRESMGRKIKLGDRKAQRKLDAFEDAVGNQKWKRARQIANMPNDGWGTKAAKAVGGFIAGLFGSDEQEMSELDIKKFRDKMNDEIKNGNKAAQKKLDKFEDAVADQNWRRARAIAKTPNTNIVTKGLKEATNFLWSGDQDSAMTDAEVEKFENEMNARIQKGDTNAQKLLDQFHEAVSNGLWQKARKISGVQKDGLLKSGLKKLGKSYLKMMTFGLYKGDADAEEVAKLEKELEEKVDKDESGIWQRIFDRFTSLKKQGMYNEARDYAEKMLSSSLSTIKEESSKIKSADELEADYRVKLRQRDIAKNIQKSYDKIGWFGDKIKKLQLSNLLVKVKESPDVNDEFLDDIEEQLQNIDSEAEITKDSSGYKVDESIRKMITVQAKLRDIAMTTKDKINGWFHPFQKIKIANLVNDLTTTTPEQLTDELILEWNNRLSEFKESGVKKITKEEVDEQRKKNEEEKNKKDEENKEKTAADKTEDMKPDQAAKSSDTGSVEVKQNKDGTTTAVIAPKASKTIMDIGRYSLVGNTLVPLPGESKQDYEKRLEKVTAAYAALRNKHPVLSIYTEKGRARYIAAKQVKALMQDSSYDENKDPVLLGLQEDEPKQEVDQSAQESDDTKEPEEEKSFFGGLWDKTKSFFGKQWDRTKSLGKGLLNIGKKAANMQAAIDSGSDDSFAKAKGYWMHPDSTLGGKLINTARAGYNYAKGGIQKASEPFRQPLLKTVGGIMKINELFEGKKDFYPMNVDPEVWNRKPVHSGSYDRFNKSTYGNIKNGIGSVSDTIRQLPYEAAVAFDKAGNIFDAVKGSLFGADVAMPEGGTVIHNHPDGSPVSETDIQSAKEAGLSSMVTLTPDSINDSIVKPVSSSVTDAVVKFLGMPSTRSDQLDRDAMMSRDRFHKRSGLFRDASQYEHSTSSYTGFEDEMSLAQQTQIIGEKLDIITNAVNGVRTSTIEAGEGITNRIKTAENTAVAKSMAYANSAVATTRPKPKEPGLKPPSIDVKRPAFI